MSWVRGSKGGMDSRDHGGTAFIGASGAVNIKEEGNQGLEMGELGLRTAEAPLTPSIHSMDFVSLDGSRESSEPR
jgi:hypothetical protein